MTANTEVQDAIPPSPGLDIIDMPWGFRMRPADMDERAVDAVVEWTLTFLGIVLLLSAFAQWILPGSIYSGDGLVMKAVLTGLLGFAGGAILSVSARGFRPEVQIDRVRNEIRFVSRNPRGRGSIMATVDLDQIIGVGITRSLEGEDCHCLIYMIDGEKPLRLATGPEAEVRAIRDRVNGFVVPPAERLARRMAKSATGKPETEPAAA